MQRKEVMQARSEAQLLRRTGNFAMRSCWNCDPAHEHLKLATYLIACFACGHWYFRGVDITTPEEPSDLDIVPHKAWPRMLRRP